MNTTTLPKAPALSVLVREAAEPFDDIETARLDKLIERIAGARVVLLGEATHGTSEFYRMRSRITRELIVRRGFQFVAVEADWPDAARINEYVRGDVRRSSVHFAPFSRFPQWMWRNEEVLGFVEWLRDRNEHHAGTGAGFHGLDLYSLFTSIAAVLAYLDKVDPVAAKVARERYGALAPWSEHPEGYAEAVLRGTCESSADAVVAMLRDLLRRRIEYAVAGGERFFDATQNARLIADAERYYRTSYYGGVASWNLRDTHMFETLKSLLVFYGETAKGVVWEHNSHVGDALATDMSLRGEHNLGQLCRQQFPRQTFIVGFGTDRGTVAAASNWDAPVAKMNVVPACGGSYERIFHDTSIPAFLLSLGDDARRSVRDELSPPRLERAIGVVYRPQTERASHYFGASLPSQFDEYIWLDKTNAVSPLDELGELSPRGRPDTYPF